MGMAQGHMQQIPYRFPINAMFPPPPIFPYGELPSPGLMHPGFYSMMGGHPQDNKEIPKQPIDTKMNIKKTKKETNE